MTHDEFIVADTGYKMGDSSTMSQSTSFMGQYSLPCSHHCWIWD
ncbi:hypothetical protein Godav_010170, partial [Gossypium davidsonii]|nr:hypothetical protein [Gossypium davidsonii]